MRTTHNNNKTMKNFLQIGLLTAVLVACNQPEDNSELGKLKAERDSLNTVQTEVTERIKEIDVELAKRDSTKKLYTVTTLNIQSKSFEHYFTVYGVVESNKSISLFAETSGRIMSINVKKGQSVAKGQLLAKLDSKVLEQNIEEVKKSLELADEIYKKQSRLWLEENIGSEVQYLEAKNNKESLETRLATLRAQLAMTRVRAPFSGVVDEIFPKVGENASPQMAMFRLVNLSDVYLTAAVSEAYVGKVTSGTPVEVLFRSLDKKFPSEIIRVGSFINPDNRTFEVNIGIDKEGEFKPNMMGSVDIQDYSTEKAIVVPSRLVMENTQGESYVYVCAAADDDICTVKKVIIEPGMSYQGETEVLSGINAGDQVVDRGSRSIKDGQKVRIVTFE